MGDTAGVAGRRQKHRVEVGPEEACFLAHYLELHGADGASLCIAPALTGSSHLLGDFRVEGDSAWSAIFVGCLTALGEVTGPFTRRA